MAPLRVRVATDADVDRIVEINKAAFEGSPILNCICGASSAQYLPFWRNRFRHDLLDLSAHVLVVEDPAGAAGAGTAVAFAIWFGPRKPSDPIPDAMPSDAWPSDGNPAQAAGIIQDLVVHHRRFMTDAASGRQTPHWYLSLIAADPAHQGRGAAGLLLRWGATRADAAGVPCYLDATPAGFVVYSSPGHGYRELGHKDYFDGTHTQVFMLRDARTG